MPRGAYRFDGTAYVSGFEGRCGERRLARSDEARGLRARAALEAILTAHAQGALGTPPGAAFDGQDELVVHKTPQDLLMLYERDAATRLPISIDGCMRLIGRTTIVAISSIHDGDPILDAFKNARPATGAHLNAMDAYVAKISEDDQGSIGAGSVIHSQTLENIIQIEIHREGYVLLVSTSAVLDGADVETRARVLLVDMARMAESLKLLHQVAEQEGDDKAVRVILDLSDETTVSKAVTHVCHLTAMLRPVTKALVIFPITSTKSQETMLQRVSITLRALLGGTVAIRHLERAAQRNGKDIDAVIASV